MRSADSLSTLFVLPSHLSPGFPRGGFHEETPSPPTAVLRSPNHVLFSNLVHPLHYLGYTIGKFAPTSDTGRVISDAGGVLPLFKQQTFWCGCGEERGLERDDKG